MQLTAMDLNHLLPIAHLDQEIIVNTLKTFMYIVIIELIYKNTS